MAKKRKTARFGGMLEDPELADIESPRDEGTLTDADICADCYLTRGEHNGPDGEAPKSKCRRFR